MLLLVVYDISTADAEGPGRLRKVARACLDYGQRVQKSVFECKVGLAEWQHLRDRLLATINPDTDSLRLYFLDADVKVEHHGTKEPLDIDGPLVI